MHKHNSSAASAQVSDQQSAVLAELCYLFLKPLLAQLDRLLDRRLVQTFLSLVQAILIHRHRNHGLLLSELGGYLASPEHAPAGTKRISRLLHATRWGQQLLSEFLWSGASQHVDDLTAHGELPLVIWDESVVEKPESVHLEGLGPVRSTKAARLKRIKPGYYNPPGGRPIFVPGMNWLMVLVAGPKGVPSLASLRWWTTRGEHAERKRWVEREILSQAWQRWGRQVLHIWDRGFASHVWLRVALIYTVRFVVRWPKRLLMRGRPDGRQRPTWQITRGKRSWDHRLIYDARRHCRRKVGVIAMPVYEPSGDHAAWLVVARPGGGREPWYLLTTEPIESVEDAWRIVFAYARRWQVEMALRFNKSELAFESPRLWKSDDRCKLLLIAALAYAFLLSLVRPLLEPLREWLLSHWCHRTGKRSRTCSAPLYRLRLALSSLWIAHPPPVLARLRLSSG